MGSPAGRRRQWTRAGSGCGRGYRPAVDATVRASARRAQMSCSGRGARAGRGPGPDAAVGAGCAPRDVVVGGWCFEGRTVSARTHATRWWWRAGCPVDWIQEIDACQDMSRSCCSQHGRCPAVPPVSSTRGGDGGSRAYSPSRAAMMPGYEIRFYYLRQRRTGNCPDGDQAGSLSGSFAVASASPTAAGYAPALPGVPMTMWLAG